MKTDRALIVSILLLATGLGLIFAYCHGATNLNATFPFSDSTVHVEFTTVGPAVLGGILFTALGLLLLVWSFLVALLSQLGHLFQSDKPPERQEAELKRS